MGITFLQITQKMLTKDIFHWLELITEILRFLQISSIRKAITLVFNSLSTNPTKWSNIFKQFVNNLPTNCLSVFDHFVKLAFKWLIFQSFCQNINKISICGIFWAFKSSLQIIHAATYIALFLPDFNNCFFICLVPYIPICVYCFLILCFYFHFLFPSLLATRHILQFTMFDSISLQPACNITDIRNYFIVHTTKGKSLH